MPNTRSAKKALRQSKRKKVFNDRRVKVLKTSVKDLRVLAVGKNKADALKALPAAYKAIDKALKTGVIKKNTAARKKSRLMKLVAKIA